jgi:hypothetical protein
VAVTVPFFNTYPVPQLNRSYGLHKFCLFGAEVFAVINTVSYLTTFGSLWVRNNCSRIHKWEAI